MICFSTIMKEMRANLEPLQSCSAGPCMGPPKNGRDIRSKPTQGSSSKTQCLFWGEASGYNFMMHCIIMPVDTTRLLTGRLSTIYYNAWITYRGHPYTAGKLHNRVPDRCLSFFALRCMRPSYP